MEFGMKDEIIEMARQAGFSIADGIVTGGVTDVEAFAKLVEEKVKQENAGAAATLDEMRRRYDDHFAKALGRK
jgi:Trk K+ transport system NAD-binding subunit